MLPHSLRWAAGTLFVPLSMLLALAVAAPVAATNPPGNNGTVKIDGLEFDRHPDNEPHVGCTFDVDFYGFDEGNLRAGVTFEAHPPTGGGILLTDTILIGADDNSGGGSEAGWDASAEYDLKLALASYPAHPQQGYHVKLTLNADGSQGADTKHKVFWVGPCDPVTLAINPHGNPPSNPHGNPPSNPPSKPASNTPSNPAGGGASSHGVVLAASGGPAVAMLPDTAMGAAATWGLVMAGIVLLSGATLAAVTVRRGRTRRH